MKKGRYFSAHLHMHSCHEGMASMAGHMYEASRLGIEAIWFTDHDTLMGKRPSRIDSCDFAKVEILQVDHAATQAAIDSSLASKLENLARLGIFLDKEALAQSRKSYLPKGLVQQGWQSEKTDPAAQSWLELLPQGLDPARPCLSFKARAGEGAFWQSARIRLLVSGKRQQRSLLGDVLIRLACRIDLPPGPDARLIIRLYLSQQPPLHKHSQVIYVLGDPAGLADDYSAVISLPDGPGGWQELALPLAEDARKHPASGGADNAFDTISLELQARNGQELAILLDKLHIDSEIENIPASGFEPMRQRQQELADLLSEKYGVAAFVANEITGAGQHKNSFCTHVPVLDYRARDYQVSQDEAIAWVRQHGGIFAINHPFSMWNQLVLSEEEKQAATDGLCRQYLASKAYGADLLEIGFPEGRYGFSLARHLQLWDQLSLNGVFITGYGCSDNHRNDANWYEGNNFAAWIYAKELTEKELTRSMARGRLYTGDPVAIKGDLVFATKEGQVMGQVVAVQRPDYTIVFKLSQTRPGWTVRWIVDGGPAKEELVQEDSFSGQLTMVMKQPLHFARVEVYDVKKRCILLTNPIYFTSSKALPVPAGRQA